MNESVPNRIPVKEIERYAKHLLPKDQKVINDLHVSCLVAVPCTSLYKRVMESFQISLQLGCLNSTTPEAFAKGRISQGKHCLRPDCECKGTANYSLTQENHMKKYEKLFLYPVFWGMKIAKLQKQA